ncbi:MAG: hypothetical protein AAGB46_04390 [Verrucomicrobiota bacterium]
MIIGVVRERKADECRVGLAPSGVETLASQGHEILVERGAGAGRSLAGSEKELFEKAELAFKVKESLSEKYGYMREG